MKLKEIIEVFFDSLELKAAIWTADLKQRAYNRRYFVLPDHNHKLLVFDKNDIARLKKPIKKAVYVNGKKLVKKLYIMNPKATHMDIMRECFYYTPVKLNDAASKLSSEEKEKRAKEWNKYKKAVRKR